jgi:hypothetical protein
MTAIVSRGCGDRTPSEEQQGCGMQGEQNNRDRDDMAGIWRNAQHRRNEDLRTWLRYFFQEAEATHINRSGISASAAAQRHHADERDLLAKRISQHEVVL